MQNYFNYYTEIEEHFQRRRGTLLMLSTLDWALIAAWREAGFPLEAVIAGIDATFVKYESRQSKGRVRRINGLAYCAQEVIRAMEDMHEAAVGARKERESTPEESGFEPSRIEAFLRQNASQLQSCNTPEQAVPIFTESVQHLHELAVSTQQMQSASPQGITTESLEQQLLVLEDRIFAALQAFTSSENQLVLRRQLVQEMAPYRSRLQTTQVRQIEQQFLRRSLFQLHNIPRLSLFYMRQI